MGRLRAPRDFRAFLDLRSSLLRRRHLLTMTAGKGRRAAPVLVAALAAGLVLAAGGGAMAQAVAQPAAAASAKPASAKPASANPAAAAKQPDKMLVEANELVQNTDANTVSAQGNVRVYYQGRTLEADKVIYNKTTKRIFAEGHAKLTERDGSVSYGDRFDLTDDFRDGFVDSLREDSAQKTHFSAPRAERTGGDTSVFDRGTYTACDACKNNPDRPPLWRVRAKRIIHKSQEQMIYYEDAYLEFLGIPLAYVPFLSTPDPTVTRKSGLLSPTTLYKSQLGYGVGLPIFFNLAPNYDLTLTPTVFTQQGFFGSGEFRQRFDNGQYYIRATGIDEINPKAFSTPPYGSADRALRGSLQTKGDFSINPNWKFGWDIAVLSDKYYLYDYSIPSETLSSNYFSESISTVFLTGQGARSFFDLRGYHFEGLSSHDIQQQQPLVRPVLDYNHTFDIDPATSHGIGGQLEFDFNLTSLSAGLASFQSVGPRTLDTAFGLYDVCKTYQPGQSLGSSCLLRGIGGDYSRATAQLSYQRKIIDPLGEVWTPFAFARLNGEDLDLNTTASRTFAANGNVTSFSNASQTAFVERQGASGTVTPGVGLEYRYPVVARTSIASLIFEPIVQVIARPDRELGSRSMVNLDSQSLVFDNSNLFEWNKYSGYDRFETGTRANYGAQFSANFNNGGYANVVAGQSAQLAGHNGFATPDAANVGLSSGLDTRRSDYVAGLTIAPASFVSFAANSRYDVATLHPRRLDLSTNFNFGALTAGIQYARYTAQPVIGYDVNREGLSFNGKYNLTTNYFLQGNVTFDLSRHLYPESIVGTDTGLFSVAAVGVGAGYTDECTTFAVNYSSVYQDNGSNTLQRNQTVLVSLQLRTLGEAKFSKSTTATSGLDGVK